jgi:hypothetical protein
MYHIFKKVNNNQNVLKEGFFENDNLFSDRECIEKYILNHKQIPWENKHFSFCKYEQIKLRKNYKKSSILKREKKHLLWRPVIY